MERVPDTDAGRLLRMTVAGVRLEALAACVPAQAVANDEKVAKATGIRARRVAAPGTTVVDLCAAAARRALEGADASDIAAVICVSFTQRDRMPCAAAQAQARLGLPASVLGFDVLLACSGWGYGLYLASLLARETGKRVLLLDGDVQSAFLDAADAATRPLLADAGTAALVGPGEDTWEFAFATDGEKGGALTLSHGDAIRMDGFGVFRFVATDVVAHLKECLQSFSSVRDAFTFVPHQPNAYMVRQLAKSLGIPEERTALSCDELGNAASASVPVTIAWRGVRGRILLAGFGGGLSVSVGAISVDASCPLSVVEL